MHAALPTVQTNDDDFFDCNDEPLHVHFEDVRTLFAIAVHTIGSDGKSLPIIQADIPQAFLQAEIDVPQYIMLPKGITVNPVYTALDTADWDNRIVRLLRSLYALKMCTTDLGQDAE